MNEKTLIINKSRHKYWLYDEFYSGEEAMNKVRELKKKNGRKIRFFIEKVYAFGHIDELFIPGDKYKLWISD